MRRRILALLVRAGRLAAPGEEADDTDPGDVLPGLLAEAVRAPRRRSRGTPRLVLGPAPLTAWEDGCSLSAARLVEPNDREGLAQLCRYGLRPALALDRLARADDGNLRYRLKRRFADGTDEIRLSPSELLRRLAALVPPPRVHQVRYHGAFAPNARGRAALTGQPRNPRGLASSRSPPPRDRVPDAPTRRDDTGPLLGAASPGPSHPPVWRAAEPDPGDEAFVGPDDPSSPRRLPWAELLRRVHRTDVLTCPRYRGPRTVLAYLSEPAVTSRILEHLCLPATPPRRAPARAPPDHHPGLPGWTDDAFVDPPAPSD